MIGIIWWQSLIALGLRARAICTAHEGLQTLVVQRHRQFSFSEIRRPDAEGGTRTESFVFVTDGLTVSRALEPIQEPDKRHPPLGYGELIDFTIRVTW